MTISTEDIEREAALWRVAISNAREKLRQARSALRTVPISLDDQDDFTAALFNERKAEAELHNTLEAFERGERYLIWKLSR